MLAGPPPSYKSGPPPQSMQQQPQPQSQMHPNQFQPSTITGNQQQFPTQPLTMSNGMSMLFFSSLPLLNMIISLPCRSTSDESGLSKSRTTTNAANI